MIDSHVHLNRAEFDGEIEAVMARAKTAGVTGFLNVGYDLVSSYESVALAKAHPNILATVGIHPHDAETVADDQGKISASGRRMLDELVELAAKDEVVAIGEIGLDFFRNLSPQQSQYSALTAQLEVAEQVDLPVVFHVRDAWRETLAHLDKIGVPRRGGVLHAFSGDRYAVDWAKEHGFLLGIGGPVTYKKSHLPELVPIVGVEQILLETDAPWLPPVPHRGKRNESAYLAHTLAKVAGLLELTPDEVTRQTSVSFGRVFGGFAGTSGGKPDPTNLGPTD